MDVVVTSIVTACIFVKEPTSQGLQTTCTSSKDFFTFSSLSFGRLEECLQISRQTLFQGDVLVLLCPRRPASVA